MKNKPPHVRETAAGRERTNILILIVSMEDVKVKRELLKLYEEDLKYLYGRERELESELSRIRDEINKTIKYCDEILEVGIT